MFEANESLKTLNHNLEKEVANRTQSLKINEYRYRILVEQAQDLIYNVDSKGHFTFLNLPGQKFFGYQEEDILGKHFLTFVPPSDIKAESKHYSNVLSKGIERDYHEFRISNNEGNIYWLGQHVTRVKHEDGTFSFTD